MFYSGKNAKISLILIGNTFLKNSGVEGGAIKLESCFKGILASNIFSENTAKKGGAIFYNSLSILTLIQ